MIHVCKLQGRFSSHHLHCLPVTTGYGYSGRVAQRCDQGYYNEGDNYNTCKACPFGMTTDGAASAAVRASRLGTARLRSVLVQELFALWVSLSFNRPC